MRKFVIVCLLALPAMALTQQRASAWCKFGFSLSFQSGGNKLCFDSGNPPASCCAPAPFVPGPVPHAPPPAFKASAGPNLPAVQPTFYQAAYWQAGYNPVSYYGTTGYNGGQVPSYWYGR